MIVRKNVLLVAAVSFFIVAFAAIPAFRAEDGAAATIAKGVGIPHTIRYDGTIADWSATAGNETVGIRFALYTQRKDETPVWEEFQTVRPDREGHYSALLGDLHSDGLPPELFTTRSALWMGITVADHAEGERALLFSAPYAYQAQNALTLNGHNAEDFVLAEQFAELRRSLSEKTASNVTAPATAALPAIPADVTLSGNQSTPILEVVQQGAGYGINVQSLGKVALLAGNSGNVAGAIGVIGAVSSGQNATGVLGTASAVTGATYGVRGKSYSSSGVGVYGVDYSTTGNTMGTLSEVYSSNGIAGVLRSNTVSGGKFLSGQHQGVETFSVDAAGNLNTKGNLVADGNIVASGTISSYGGWNVNNLVTSGTLKATGGVAATGNISTTGALTATGDITTQGKITGAGSLSIGDISAKSLMMGSLSSTSGQAGIFRNDLDTGHVSSQAGANYHFRMTRGTPDITGLKPDFLIAPYKYGYSVDYNGLLEFWTQAFSVHGHCTGCNTGGAQLWVGDDWDAGGLYVTSRSFSPTDKGFVYLAADKFPHTSHGPMEFNVRDLTDAFIFQNGAWGKELPIAQIHTVSDSTHNMSSLESINGGIVGSIMADAQDNVVRIGSRSAHGVQLVTNDSNVAVSVYPSGDLSIGNNADTALLSVGSSGQFNVNQTGAVTIGGGTPITRHISINATVSMGTVAASSCVTTTANAAGAADGDSVALGVSNALASVNGITWFGWASNTNTVSIRACNATSSPVGLGAGNIRVDVWKHGSGS